MSPGKMAEKNKAETGNALKKEQYQTAETCEICGQKLERDPESGEFYCPDCCDPDQ